MDTSVRDRYIETIDSAYAPAVIELDRIVMETGPQLEPRIAYGILMYVLEGRVRPWVAAISTTKKGFQLRFLAGTLMDDPAKILRSGTGPLKTIDFTSIDDIDADVVRTYVAEALARNEELRATV